MPGRLLKYYQEPKGRLQKYIGTEDLEPKRFKGDVMSWIDRYLRSQYAVAGMTKEWGRARREQRPGKYKEAFRKGITGKEKTYFREVFKEAGYGPKASAIMGFGGDVLLDPLTYLSLGTTVPGKVVAKGVTKKAVGKKMAQKALALKFAGKPVIKSVAAAKAMAKTGQAIVKTPGVGRLVKLFVKTTGNPVLDEVIRRHTGVKQYGRVRALKVGNKEVRHIVKLSNRLKKPIKEVADEIVNLLEVHRVPAKIKARASHPLIAQTAIRHRGIYKKMITAEMKAGVKIKPLGVKRLEQVAKARRQLSVLIKSRKIAKEKGLQVRVRQLTTEIKILKGQLKPGVLRKQLAAGKVREFKTGEEILGRGLPGTRKIAKRIIGREEAIRGVGKEVEYTRRLGMKGKLFRPTEKELISISKELKVGGKQARRIGRLRKARELGYYPRITKEEALQFLQTAKIGRKKVWSPALSNAIERKTGDFTLKEWNAFVQKHGLRNLDAKALTEFFSPDPAYALAKRMERGTTAITAVKMRKEVGRLFGKSPKRAPAHWPILEGTGRKIPPEIAREVDNVYKFYTSGESVTWFVRKIFDPTQKWWKAHVLSYFPGYHVRNVATNTMNNYWAGVWNLKDFDDAIRLQFYRNMKLAGKKVPKPKLSSGINVDLAVKMGERHGIPGRGIMAIEVPKALELELMKGNWNVLSQNFIPVKYGRFVGTMLENNARWWHFLDKVRHGHSWTESAQSVKKFLFDYADLTTFERRVMKRVFPFYTWTRKNLPLQLEQMIKQPGKYAGYIKAKRAVEAKTPAPREEEAMLPEYLKERWPMRVGKTEKGEYTYFPLEGYLPIADVFKLQRPLRTALSMLDPYFLKLPLEQAINRNLYFDRPIETVPGERQRFLGKEIPSRQVHVLRTLRILGEINRLMSKYGEVPEQYKKYLTPELTGKQKALRGLTGIKLEKIDPKKALSYFKYKTDKQLREIKSAYRRALMQGRTEEAARMRKLYISTMKEAKRKLGR